MKFYTIPLIAMMAIVTVPFIASAVQRFRSRGLASAFNIAGTHKDAAITRISEDGLNERYLLVTAGTDPGNQVLVCGANDEPSAVADDEAVAGEIVATLGLSTANSTRFMIAAVPLDPEERVYTDAAGRVTNVSAPGVWLVGKAKTIADEVGDIIEVETCFPVEVV